MICLEGSTSAPYSSISIRLNIIQASTKFSNLLFSPLVSQFCKACKFLMEGNMVWNGTEHKNLQEIHRAQHILSPENFVNRRGDMKANVSIKNNLLCEFFTARLHIHGLESVEKQGRLPRASSRYSRLLPYPSAAREAQEAQGKIFSCSQKYNFYTFQSGTK